MQYSDRVTMSKKYASVILSTLLALLVVLSLFACNKLIAAELGEATVRSYYGQPLELDIELTALAPDEMTGLQAKLASLDVYRSANVRIDPALASLRIALKQEGARQFLHATTSQAIDADYLHLFLELHAGGRYAVRTITVWLSADPTPRPAFQPASRPTRQQSAASLAQSDPPSSVPLADRRAAAAANGRDPEVRRSRAYPMPVKVMAKNAAENLAVSGVGSGVTNDAANVSANRTDGLAKNSVKNNAKNSAKNSSRDVAEREAANTAKTAVADDAVRVSEQTIAALGLENADLKTRIATLEQKNVALQQVDASKQAAIALALAVAEKPTQASSGSSLAIAGALLLGLTVFGLLGFFGFRYRKTLAASRIGIVSNKLLRRKATPPTAPATSKTRSEDAK